MQSTIIQLERFVEFVRTKQLLISDYKEPKYGEFVFISMKEIRSRFLVDPEEEIPLLAKMGEIEVKSIPNRNGMTLNYYNAVKPGYYNLNLLVPKGRPLDGTTKIMMNYLKDVSLENTEDASPYFNAFLKFRHLNMPIFFTIDHFSGRVHTPVTNLKSVIRQHIMLEGEATIAIDMVTAQAVILGAILKEDIGKNDFSTWIDNGEDVYIKLQEAMNLPTREKAKKMFLKIIFAPPSNELDSLFGKSNWVTWVNAIKSKPMAENPRTHIKVYSNLAWLLQSNEVKLMREVWEHLIKENIKFLSVHDEIIVKESDFEKAIHIMHSVLSQYLTFFKLSSKKVEKYVQNTQLQSHEKLI